MNNFTPRAQQVLTLARKEAKKLQHDHIGSEHLLLGLLRLKQGVAVNVLEKLGVNIDAVTTEVENNIESDSEKQQTKGGSELPYTPRVRKILSLAGKEAKNLNHSYVGTEHILLGILKDSDSIATQILKNLDIDVDEVREEILSELNPNEKQEHEGEDDETQDDDDKELEMAGGGREKKDSTKKVKTPALKAFGKDLTEMAKKGELDPVIGREDEVLRVVQILCRRTKNNPVLIGEAGVGKTAIAEGLALAISSGLIPENLINKRVISLDLALMIAGTKYRGQFEERIKAVMDEIKKSKNVILFLDELHTIVGAGSAEGTMDASNIFKPALSRGELQCIGATTLNEYRKYIEKDAALERRFQQVKVEPPNVENAIKILEGIKHKYEAHHKAKYTPEALKASVTLSDRYISGRHLPDKAIDVMDEAGSLARINNSPKSPDTKPFEEKVQDICNKKEEAIKSQDFEKAAELRDQEKIARKELSEFLEAWKNSTTVNEVIIDEDAILKIVAKWTGIPLARIDQNESKKILKMEEDLKDAVIGQNQAVASISRAIKRSRADLKDPKRPIGSFVFLGPTGVGKTYLAKNLAKFMFGDPDSIIQIDMSEYMEKFSVSRLIGAPPGYIGHDEGGQLTEAVRRKPYSVVLFDEIEKAHPDVMNLMLQILEDGTLTDSLGRKIDFKNTIVIMTSNVGAQLLNKERSMGFGTSNSENNKSEEQSKILEETKRHFKPEFLNRIDELIVFSQLDKESIKTILNLEVEKIRERLKSKEINFELDEQAEAFLVTKGYDSQYGARPMRRAVEQYLEDPLAEDIIKGTIDPNNSYIIGINPDGSKLIVKKLHDNNKKAN